MNAEVEHSDGGGTSPTLVPRGRSSSRPRLRLLDGPFDKLRAGFRALRLRKRARKDQVVEGGVPSRGQAGQAFFTSNGRNPLKRLVSK